MIKLSLPLSLIPLILLFGCGGGGINQGQTDENSPSTKSSFFSDLDQGLPYFIDASEHDLLTLGTNLFLITVPFTLGVGAEGDNCTKSGSFDTTETARLVGTTKVISDSQDVYNNCISSTDAYQNGIITIHSIQNGENASNDITAENFVNTNFRSGDREPMKSHLKNIKISESGVFHQKISKTTIITTIEELIYSTENNSLLKINNYVHELYSAPSQSPISHIYKKSNYSANWTMKHDASHHKLVSTSPIPTVGDTFTLPALPQGLIYKLDVEITKELVYLKNSNSPVTGSYKITLTNSNNTNSANGFNASTIILDTKFENGKATVSRYVCEVTVYPNTCEEVNLPTQWEINL